MAAQSPEAPVQHDMAAQSPEAPVEHGMAAQVTDVSIQQAVATIGAGWTALTQALGQAAADGLTEASRSTVEAAKYSWENLGVTTGLLVALLLVWLLMSRWVAVQRSWRRALRRIRQRKQTKLDDELVPALAGRSATVAIVGLPGQGKSTFMNAANSERAGSWWPVANTADGAGADGHVTTAPTELEFKTAEASLCVRDSVGLAADNPREIEAKMREVVLGTDVAEPRPDGDAAAAAQATLEVSAENVSRTATCVVLEVSATVVRGSDDAPEVVATKAIFKCVQRMRLRVRGQNGRPVEIALRGVITKGDVTQKKFTPASLTKGQREHDELVKAARAKFGIDAWSVIGGLGADAVEYVPWGTTDAIAAAVRTTLLAMARDAATRQERLA